jgi:hypothetical protein
MRRSSGGGEDASSCSAYVIAETWQQSGSNNQDPTTRTGSLALYADGRFVLEDPLDNGTLEGTWTAGVVGPAPRHTPGKLALDPNDRVDATALAFELRTSYKGLIGDRLSLSYSNDDTAGHGAVTFHFARRGAFHRTPERRTPRAEPADLPRVIRTVPTAGETGVSPAQGQLIVEFSEPMDTQTTAWIPLTRLQTLGEPPVWETPTRCRLAVKLAPGESHQLALNSEQIVGFRAVDGRPAAPFRWTFETRT